MTAYTFDTSTALTAQLSSTGNLDAVTAAQISAFLAANGKFPSPSSTVKVEGPTVGDGATPNAPLYFTGLDATTGVDVYEINGTQNYNYGTGLATGSPLPGFLELNSTGDTLPSGAAIVMAYAGADTINVDDNVSSNYLIATGSGNDFVNMHNSTGNNTILTGAGADSITLGSGHTTLYSGTGNDTINAFAPGTNLIYGYSSLASDGGNDQFYLGGGTNTVFASDGNNTFTVIDGNNTLNLGSGNNVISGGPTGSLSDVSVYNLGSGNDTVTTGIGTGTINGGIGQDSIVLANGGAWAVNMDTATAAAQSYVPGQPATYNDVVNIASGANTVSGGAANLAVNVNGGTNTITGGSGTDDFEINTSSHQSLVGGSHFDLINLNGSGGAGTDTITGGTGALYTNVNLTSGSVSIDGSASSSNTIDFTQFSSAQATITHNGATSDTYSFGSGLSVTIVDPTHATVTFGH